MDRNEAELLVQAKTVKIDQYSAVTLRDIVDRCMVGNWDGNGALAISEATVKLASALIVRAALNVDTAEPLSNGSIRLRNSGNSIVVEPCRSDER